MDFHEKKITVLTGYRCITQRLNEMNRTNSIGWVWFHTHTHTNTQTHWDMLTEKMAWRWYVPSYFLLSWRQHTVFRHIKGLNDGSTVRTQDVHCVTCSPKTREVYWFKFVRQVSDTRANQLQYWFVYCFQIFRSNVELL